MRRRWLTLFTAGFIAATALASCERSSKAGLDSPTGPVASVGARQYELIRQRPGTEVGAQGAVNQSQVIGLQGGTLHAGDHTLVVPQGAVAVPTVFTLNVLQSGYLEIEATALVDRLVGRPLNVGAQGFSRPVTLTLSYANAANVPADPSGLTILEKLGGYAGPFRPVRSTVDPASRTVSAQLHHFSGYIMALN